MNSDFSPIPAFHEAPQWLFVDDDAGILNLLVDWASCLTTARLNCFGSSLAALEWVQKTSIPLTFVITDLELPVMDGCELSSCLWSARPAIKIVLSSGSNRMSVAARGMGFCALLPKPYNFSGFRNVLRQAGVIEPAAEIICRPK